MMLLKLGERAAAVVMSGCFLLCSHAAEAASTSVSISASANVEGIAASGSVVSSGGLDGAGNVYAAALLGTTTTWDGVVFSFGKVNTLDAISGSTLNLPAGSYSTLYLLATGVFGDQLNQTFVVTYTDGTSSTFKQSLSDWRTPQNYAGESTAMVQSYRLNASGAIDNGPFYVYGYSFAISKGKTAKSVTLPGNRDVVVLALSLGPPLETNVSIAGATNVDGIAAAGAAATAAGLDGRGYAYSAALLGTSTTWSGVSFALGAAGALDASSGSTLSLPAGHYTTLNMLATGVNGGAANQSFIVNYTDGTSSTFLQSISDWYTPQNYAGESIALTEAYRISPSGAAQNGPFYVYGYSFAISSTKIVKSLQLPRNRDVIVLGITLSSSGLQPVSSAPPVAPAVVVTPAAPTGVSATAENAQVALSWTASSGASSYLVLRSTTSGGGYTTLGSTSSNSYLDTTVVNGTTYYYVVEAVNAAGTSGNSAQVSALPNSSVAVAPTQFTGIPGNNSVSLLWQASSGATSYQIGRSTTSGGPYTTIGTVSTATLYRDATAVNGRAYYYVVAATNVHGTGTNSVQAGPYVPNSMTQGTWVNITPPIPGGIAGTYGDAGITYDPNNRNIIYANSAWPNGPWKSTDQGNTWAQLGTPPAVGGNTTPFLDSPYAIVVDPNDSTHMYASDGVRGTSLGFWESHNSGATWTMPSGFVTLLGHGVVNPDVTQFAVDPTDFKHVIVSNHSPWTGYASSGTSETKDGGLTWTTTPPVSSWTSNTHALNMLYNPALGIGNAQTWLVADQSDGMWRTTDSGVTWTQVSTYSGVHNGGYLFYGLDGTLYAGSTPYPIYSKDNGITWTQLNKSGLNFSYYSAVVGDGNVLYTMPSSALIGTLINEAFLVTPQSTGATSAWTPYQGGAQPFINGPFQMVYDSVNGLMYAVNWGAGALRLRVIAP